MPYTHITHASVVPLASLIWAERPMLEYHCYNYYCYDHYYYCYHHYTWAETPMMAVGLSDLMALGLGEGGGGGVTHTLALVPQDLYI
jgi:hypothetical protein